MAELNIRRWVAMRRRWPYWNWVIWERITGPWTETLIVDEGLALYRATAEAQPRRHGGGAPWMT